MSPVCSLAGQQNLLPAPSNRYLRAEFVSKALLTAATSGVSVERRGRGSLALSQRANRFASESEAIAAVAADLGLAIVEWVPCSQIQLGETMVLTLGDSVEHVEVIGPALQDMALNGNWISDQALRRLKPDLVASRSFVAVDGQYDPDKVAESIQNRFLEHSAVAESFSAEAPTTTRCKTAKKHSGELTDLES